MSSGQYVTPSRAPIVYEALEKVRLAEIVVTHAVQELQSAQRQLIEACRVRP